MPGTFFGLEIARRGLQAHRTAMDITGHNVANASTPGYTRQEAVIAATDPYANPTLGSRLLPGQLGTGVEATMIRRIKNEYLDVQARDSISSREYWQVQEEIFGRIEAVFPEPGASGIAGTLTKFFNTWHDLNNTPQDPGVKAAVAETGDELATMMREAYQQLDDISTSILKIDSGNVTGGQLKDHVDAVNEILRQIRELTESIKRVYVQGNQPNDLLDRRDLLLDRLAEYGPVSVTYLTDGGKPTGEIALTFFGVDVGAADATVELVPVVDQSSGKVEEVKLQIGNQTVSLTNYPANLPKAGSLAGLEETRAKIDGYSDQAGNKVEGYKDKLENLARALKNTIYQALNHGHDGIPNNDIPDEIDFFTGSLVGGDFAVNRDILKDPTLIDGTNALYVARLATTGMDGTQGFVLGEDAGGNPVKVDLANLSGTTFNEYFNALLADIGARSGSASDMAESRRAVTEQVESLRQSVSGVNLDEELSRLIQYQYGYQASARVLAAIDEMLDYLINRTG
ncbi:flagellar hook-associated protein FlgK [Desulfofundulus thermosubterraneus]|uniref:Flagellar hook-associated protein 1 n=1 Tax=Desulfofundulus thermosubterraneus DSM 16057 TaxID=1121432 RepID=A0A1M6K404_9FIRM|nr:flagellar hook-associated protein FlgK [Desulfofundulus thermosubterraneus]SHJ53659.1 flagellar hook-associated protein 1 FlgK [Desulfofundulus thermosubterraneus DSM 16057]